MTAIQNNLKRIWDCIEQKAPEVKYLLKPGLKSEEIDELTKDLPFKLPQEVYELYQWRNGLSDDICLEYPGFYNCLTVNFDSLETTIQDIKKLQSRGEIFYFIIIYWLHHEN
ncbi:MAG: hypothetical protein WBA41_17520 [Rivularia sp. (in: cyanobacteria)]